MSEAPDLPPNPDPHPDPDLAVVVIGRNEGARLIACLDSLRGLRVVYVDSGSSDGSVAAARARGAHVVMLDMALPFTAARARNAGVAALKTGSVTPEFVQFLDGDCLLDPGWIATARAVMQRQPRTAVVCGRRREIFPDASPYNAHCDREWNTPVGRSRACGGDALMRLAAFDQVGGFDPGLIAGEEPDLCLRLRAQHWEVWRIAAEMTRHDAAITRFGQFWTRARRAGHAFAEGAARHGKGPERHFVAETRRALIWGPGVLAAGLIGAALFGPPGCLPWAAWPAQVVRLAARRGHGGRFSRAAWSEALLLTLSKPAEGLGVIRYHLGRVRGRSARLIEYK